MKMMFTKAEKAVTHHNPANKPAGMTFFRKAGEETFASKIASTIFFNPSIQTKINVSKPDDPQEKEADEVAHRVMTMPEQSVALSTSGVQEIGRKEDKEEEVVIPGNSPSIQRMAEDEREEKSSAATEVQRSDEEEKQLDRAVEDEEEVKTQRSPQPDHSVTTIYRSGRGPPSGQMSVEDRLERSNGSGASLPENTRTFMENRFGADFSGVRIHTGQEAAGLSSDLHAQAFGVLGCGQVYLPDRQKETSDHDQRGHYGENS